MVGIASEEFNHEAVLAQSTGEAGQRSAMQDQLVGMERVLAKEKVMLDEYEHGVASRFKMLVEELMRQNEAHTRAGLHTLTIEGRPQGPFSSVVSTMGQNLAFSTKSGTAPPAMKRCARST